MKTPCPDFWLLREAALAVAKEFPGLSASAFFEEVRGRFYPRPDEFDIRGLALRLVADGELIYDGNWKVRLPCIKR